MSDKKRRDITLGEMQDECKTRKVCETANEKCSYYGVCAFFHRIAPSKINLIDPPRFTEAQMALLQWWYERGARTAVLIVDHRYGEKFGVLLIFRGSDSEFIGDMTEKSMCAVFEKEFPNEQRADLAELLRKDGAET